MLKVIAIIAVIAVVLLAGFAGYAATRPDTLRVERSVSIEAPPETIYPLIADLQTWRSWSPWEKKDPAMKRTYAGAAAGMGATYAWEGNREIGSGRMEIVDANPSRVLINLDFIEPFEAHNMAEFRLAPEGDSTRVTWTMEGPQNLIGKMMCVVIDMDQMIGEDFETGLANLKAIAEKSAPALSS